MEKATFRLPEWEMENMRRRSREESRSLNSVAAELIALGLKQESTEPGGSAVASALGALLQRPAQAAFRPGGERSPVRLTDALDWSRGEE